MSTADDPGDAPPIVQSSTIHNADVVVHAHIRQRPIDIQTQDGEIDVQLLADECLINGVQYHNPDRPLRLEDVSVTYEPHTGTVEIRTE